MRSKTQHNLSKAAIANLKRADGAEQPSPHLWRVFGDLVGQQSDLKSGQAVPRDVSARLNVFFAADGGDKGVLLDSFEKVCSYDQGLANYVADHVAFVHRELALEKKKGEDIEVKALRDNPEAFLAGEPDLQDYDSLAAVVVTPGSPLIDLCALFNENIRNRADFDKHLIELQNERKGPRKKAFKMVVCVLALGQGYNQEEEDRLAAHGEKPLSELDPMIERRGKFSGMSRAMAWRQRAETPKRLSVVSKFLGGLETAGHDYDSLSIEWKRMIRASKDVRNEANRR